MCKFTQKDQQNGKMACPLCNGEKAVAGFCTCDMEWRGTKQGSEWKDCRCTPAQTCPTCKGTGTIYV